LNKQFLGECSNSAPAMPNCHIVLELITFCTATKKIPNKKLVGSNKKKKNN